MSGFVVAHGGGDDVTSCCSKVTPAGLEKRLSFLRLSSMIDPNITLQTHASLETPTPIQTRTMLEETRVALGGRLRYRPHFMETIA